MKGYVRAEVTKSRRFRVEFWYMYKRKSSANRDGPAGQDQERKQEDTYKLKRRNATISGTYGYTPKCKSSANRLGLREQDRETNWIRMIKQGKT